jgi:DHA2 family multidrug resistance protein
MTETVPLRTWMAVVGASLGGFLVLLNIQGVGSLLTDIQATLGASADEGSWIQTAFLVAAIVNIPLIGWLSRAFSVRIFMIGNGVLFIVFTVACGLARDLDQMIVLRVLQGLTVASMVPMSFTLVITLLPAARQPTGIAIVMIQIALGTAIGPVLGGWLSDIWGWSALFFACAVPGLIMVGMLWVALDREPMRLELLGQGDWPGIITMAAGLASLQTVLQEGERQDWFESPFIARLAATAVLSLAAFVWIELHVETPLINLRLLARRNFGAGAVAMFLFGIALFGSLFLLPGYLARVQGYSAQHIGIVVAWTALPQLLTIPLVPLLLKRVDARWLAGLGLVLFAASNLMLSGLTPDIAAEQLLLPDVVRAVGEGLIATPLSMLAIAGIGAADAASASALLVIMRTLGGAIGIASLKSILARREQLHIDQMSEAVSLLGQDTRDRLEFLTRYFLDHGASDANVAGRKAMTAIARSVYEQATVMAFGDAFYILAATLLLALVTVALYRRPRVTMEAEAD